MERIIKKYLVLAIQPGVMTVIGEANTLEDATAYIEGYQGEASFAIQYPDGTMHGWEKPRRV